ncbi:MAG TPA: glycosyltransferase family 4 protein [Pirellulales bacterium]|jgi:glycosyltransferase involved in cell wall biosynthesis|nr:glycosyltransferase family 4 protein [Pirellulales bacterium]
MQVLALTEGPNHVCYRYRIAPFADALRDRGWQLSALPLAPRTLERGSQLRAAASADVVILQRKLLPLWQLRALRRWARVLIYDFDDALFHRDSYSRKGASSWTRLAHFWATIHTADAVLAGNGYLRAQAAAYIPPERVHWMPTSVDPARYPLARHTARGSQVQLVWIGQHSTLPCLSYARPLLEAAAERLPGLRLKVICNRFPVLDPLEVLPRVWSAETEAADIASADIGVSWLPDDPWSQGKCGLKVLQYMAAGLPVVANPVGMNRQMIVHGENGFLADSAEEWAAAITRLASDPRLRERMGAAGRAMAEEHYSVHRWAPRFAALIERVAGSGVSANAGQVPRPHFALDREVSR